MKPETAVLLINVGSPDKPEVPEVRRYLFQFLNDRRVIDIPWLLQKILVNLIIVPFRAPKSTKLYQMLWTEQGSPLIMHGKATKQKLQDKMGDKAKVFLAMRYGKPSIKNAISEIKAAGFKKLVVIPLYPQFALSTTETSIEYVKLQLRKQKYNPELKAITQFYDHPMFLEAFANQIKKYKPEEYDHFIFSYHGLPNRQVEKTHPGIEAEACSCTQSFPAHGKNCYKAQCYETSRLLAAKLGLDKSNYTVSFQSRLSNNWLKPFTDETLEQLLSQGKKKILVAAPSFVADCLETTVEISIEYKEDFINNGGKKLELVESLNSEDSWIELLEELVRQN